MKKCNNDNDGVNKVSLEAMVNICYVRNNKLNRGNRKQKILSIRNFILIIFNITFIIAKKSKTKVIIFITR